MPERGTNNFIRQQIYFKHIKRIKGLIFRKGYYSRWANPPVEKLTDVNLAVDMVDTCHRDEFDVAFVISGDADLCPAVDVLVWSGPLLTSEHYLVSQIIIIYHVPLIFRVGVDHSLLTVK